MARLPLGQGPALWAELWGLLGDLAPEAPMWSGDFAAPWLARRAYRVVRSLGFHPVLRVTPGRRRLGFQVSVERPEVPLLAEQSIALAPEAYLRGCFLVAGYMQAPEHEYHWEIRVRDAEGRRRVLEALGLLGIRAKWSGHRSGFLVYLKGREQVEAILTHLGAHRQTLALANIGVVKGMRNQVNRLVNSETANLKRAVTGGLAQTQAIQQLVASPLWEHLEPSLREVAQLRLAHPDWSLREIGDACRPPQSKSAVNHRMRRLRALVPGKDGKTST